MRKHAASTLLLCAWVSVPLSAQLVSTQSGTKLAYIIPQLYGPNGLVLAPSFYPPGTPGATPNHQGHFNAGFQQAFSPFNSAIATQLTVLPMPSPASGFIYHEDEATGLVTRSAESFGPVLTERAETIGKRKFFMGVANQYFHFSKLDGVDLNSFPALFTHDVENNIRSKDVISSNNSISLQLDQTIAFFTYGLSDRVDVSAAVPFMHASMSANSVATIQRLGTAATPTIHTFVEGQDVNQKVFVNSGSASGIGDVIFRVKGTVFSTKRLAAAAAADIRLPSGDEKNFLGSGAWGIKPFAVLSFPGIVSPHVNVGYAFNGKSILAGNDILNGAKARLPNSFFYAIGTDVGVVPRRLSLAFDLLGERLFDTAQVLSMFYDTQAQAYTNTAGSSTFPSINIKPKTSISMNNASIGFKFSPVGQLLVTANLLVAVDSGGMRQRVVPLIGLSYTLK